jgi:hypothetical protein
MDVTYDRKTINNYFESVRNYLINEKIDTCAMNLFHLNVRGLNKLDKFEKLKTTINKLKNKPAIIALTETKLGKKFPITLYNINGYQRISCCRNVKGNNKIVGGGILVFINKSITLRYHTATTLNQIEKIKLEVTVENKNFAIIIYYRAPNNVMNVFLNDLETELNSCNDNLIILGDINIDASQTNDYINMLACYESKVINNHATRDSSGKVIDHFVCNFSDNFDITLDTISWNKNETDHNAIIARVKGVNWKTASKIECKFNHIDKEKLHHEFCERIKLTELQLSTSSETIATNIINCIQEATKLSTSHFAYRIKRNNKVPWITHKIMEIIKKKDKLLAVQRKSRSTVRANEIKAISSLLKKKIYEEKKRIMLMKFSEKNTKILWRNINTFLGREKKKHTIAIEMDDKQLIHDPQQIANLFNVHFTSKMHALKNNISVENQNFNPPNVQSSMVLNTPSKEDLIVIISQLSNNKSPGLDGIKNEHIRVLKNELVEAIVILIRKMIECGEYPAILKKSIVTPINKSGKLTNIEDYRGVSMLSNINKIIEKYLFNELYNYIYTKANVIYKRQYGFRRNCSTENAANDLFNFVNMELDKKLKVSLLMLDLKMAFDIVDKTLLLNTLHSYGIRGSVLNLIESYLTNRTQMVRFNGYTSDELPIDSGVVQGSILGSLLFTIFFNTISHLNLTGTLFLFADDLVLVNSCDRKLDIQNAIERDMEILLSYFNSQKLVVNASKSNFIIFNPGAKDKNLSTINVRDTSIARVYEVKYLGLLIDHKLHWNCHINHIQTKISMATGILHKLKHRLPTNIKKLLYHTLIESHLTYLITIWGVASDNVINKLQVTQNRAIRNIFNRDSRDNRVEMFTHHAENLKPIRTLHFIRTACLIFQIIHKKTHSNIQLMIKPPSRTNKSSHNLTKIPAKTNYGVNTITNIGVEIFNYIPDEIKQLPHVRAFKWALSCNLRNEEFMSLCFNNGYLRKFH